MRKAPIILIPGIQGTTLTNINNKDFTKVFSGIKKNFVNIHNIELQADGVSDIGRENIIERSDVEDLAYSEIINYFRSRGFSVYIFGYDWRRSNADTAIQLDLFIKSLTNKLNRSSFNFVTHSMGGLVLSAYFKLLGESGIAKVVNKAVFTVPPFLGSMEAAVNMIVGKSMLINSSDDVRKVVRTFPAIYELYPVYKGAFTYENPAKEDTHYTDYDAHWQHNASDFSAPEDYIRKGAEKKKNLISKKFEKLSEFRDAGEEKIFDFDPLPATLKERFIVLAGTNVETITRTKILNHGPNQKIVNFFDFEHFPPGEGDGTVPIHSAAAFKSSIMTLTVKSKAWETRYNSHFILNDWHSFFLNNGRVQNVMKRFLEWRDEDLTGTWFTSSADGVNLVV